MSEFKKFRKWLAKPFPKKMKFLSLAKYWFVIFFVGIVLRATVLTVYPPSGQLEEQFLSDFCTPVTLLIAILAPLTENFIFMILPYMWKKEKGLAVGLALWVFLHYVDRDLPSLAQNLMLSVFYFKTVSAKKYKESVFFHGIINWLAGLTCLF
jgi:TRAP-type mannitol/chloroaromatic compound transport system permease large subunit